MSSPPRRGCFLSGRARRPHHSVFPASAGVFLRAQFLSHAALSLPRLGGGVSTTAHKSRSRPASSPPRRGCFGQRRSWRRKRNVFPASAGVFPASAHKSRSRPGLPRLGGGVSPTVPALHQRPKSSPPRRGCFQIMTNTNIEAKVFPASAGVFLRPAARRGRRRCLPRLGGGVSSRRACP